MAPNQLNIEYWFRQIYDLAFGGHIQTTGITTFFTSIWIWITIIGYAAAAAAIALIVYCLLQLFELRAREEEAYGIVHVAPESSPKNRRWLQIEQLMASENQNDWRQAIIEADIMLAETLTREGYMGATIGDQLKQISPNEFASLQDAWEAHKVRNDIAHAGSSFDLSSMLASRTISRYENVFREMGAI